MPLLNINEPGSNKSQLTQETKETAIGIDLGTTNSLVAISRNQKPEILLDQNGNFTQPSIVGILENQLVSGALFNNISDKVFSIKRLMGKGFADFDSVKNLPFKIKNNQEQLKIVLGGKEFSVVEISAQILRNLKAIAENNLKQLVNKAVITVPAYFDENARNATKQAANLAGLEVLRLISEPTAAAVAYGLDQKAEGKFLIFDLGGGTFDVSILELTKGVFKVIGVGGDANLGGDDFDNLISEQIIQQNQLKNLSLQDLQKIKIISKNIKEEISQKSTSQAIFKVQNKEIDFSLSQNQFEILSQNLIDKTIQITQKLLTELDLSPDQIKAVVLVGGSTRMIKIKSKLQDFFGIKKVLDNIDPDKIVALGAAIQAEALTTKNSENLLLDVIPLSLGIEIMGGLVEKIIERNSTIPTSASKEFTTYMDGQNAMKLHILQGEREMVKDCRSLAIFEIKNIPALKAGVARVKVNFRVDADGLLTVSAVEQISGKTQSIEIKPSFGLNPNQVREMLLESLKNSQSDIKQRLLIEAIIEAKRNILALNQALMEDKNLLDEETLQKTTGQIKNLEQAIASNDQSQINLEAENLEKFAQKLAEKKMDREITKSLIGKKIDEL